MRPTKKAVLYSLSLALFAIPGAAKAAVVVDNSISPSHVENAWASDTEFSSFAGEDFTIDTSAIVNQIRWSGYYSGVGGDNIAPLTDNFTIELYSFASSQPAIIPIVSFNVGNAVNRTNTGVKLNLSPLFSFDAMIPQTELSPGHYLLSIYDRTEADPGDFFAWSFASSNDRIFYRRNTTGSWSTWPDISFDFTILGPESSSATTPEPASFLAWSTLALLGLAARFRLAVGDRVKILRGALAGLVGNVLAIQKDNLCVLAIDGFEPGVSIAVGQDALVFETMSPGIAHTEA